MKIAVIIPIHKSINVNHLREACESILNQSFPPSEIIFVKDGNLTSELSDYLHFLEFNQDNIVIKIVSNQKNLGPGLSRNLGVENSTCELIAFMDADDVSYHNRFEIQSNIFINSDFDIVGGQIDEYDEILSNLINKRKVPTSNNEIRNVIKFSNPINNVTVMMKKSTFHHLNGFPALYFGEDYVLWLKAIDNNFKICNLEETLVKVRTGNNFVEKRIGYQNLINNFKLFNYLKNTNSMGIFFSLYRLFKILLIFPLPLFIKKYLFVKFNRSK